MEHMTLRKGFVNEHYLSLTKNGIIRWSHLSPIGVNPGAEGVLDALENMNSSFLKQEQELESRQARESGRRRTGVVIDESRTSKLRLDIDSNRNHIQGSDTAVVTLLEYGDYECPYCGQAYPIIKQIQNSFGEDLRFAFRNFPITQSHPHAQNAAEAAESAGSQNKFWEMHDYLYEHQQALDDIHLEKYARELRLDLKKFNQDMSEHIYLPRVKEDFLSGVRSGVNGTPCFYINGIRYDDSWDIETFTERLRNIVNSKRSDTID